jgi:hypothetical protein
MTATDLAGTLREGQFHGSAELTLVMKISTVARELGVPWP